jgi:selenocysteine lyase/cysteine desulfurase
VRLAEAQALWSPAATFLNTASFGLPPQPAWEALQAALADWRHGRTSWEAWNDETDRARRLFARLVGVPPERVAVGGTVAELVGLVAAAAGTSRVVAPEGEFTSLLWPWLAQGGEVRAVPVPEVADAIDEATDVVVASIVQSSSGAVLDVDAVCAAAEAAGALVVLDATQACGWLPVDGSRADALACTGYKWLCTPRGTAYLSLSERLLERVVPAHAGWFAGDVPYASFYGAPLRLAGDARRLDTSPAWFSWVAAVPTLELLLEIGVDEIHRHDVALANRFRAGLGLPAGDSAIVSAEVEGAAERLEQAGIRASTRAGSLRAAFHVYNTDADVDAALDALAAPV